MPEIKPFRVRSKTILTAVYTLVVNPPSPALILIVIIAKEEKKFLSDKDDMGKEESYDKDDDITLQE